MLPYDPAWHILFKQEAQQLAQIFSAEIVAIHHIGSTSIPGIPAKPIIIIMPVVQDIQRIEGYNAVMLENGYVARGEFGIPGRRFFIKGGDEHRSHHLHIFQVGNPEIERHLAFRDYMIAHPQEAQAYGALKESLARQYPFDMDGYVNGKDQFIKDIDRKARVWCESLQLNRPDI